MSNVDRIRSSLGGHQARTGTGGAVVRLNEILVFEGL